MVVVQIWTGREASVLRHARRMSVRAYAAHLGLAVATVSNWDSRGRQARLNTETQQLLDIDLDRAPDDVRQRFAAAIAGEAVAFHEVHEPVADGLAVDRGPMGLAYTAVVSPIVEAQMSDPSLYEDFLGVLAALAVGTTPAGLARLLPPRPTVGGVPTVVTGEHVRVLAEVSDRHRRFDADRGGGACRDSAVAYLRWAHGMLRSRFDSEQTERALRAALSDMYQVAGWACHDLGDNGAARRYLTAGLALAREIDDLPLIAGAFYRLGRISIHQGRAQEALRCWQLGQIVAQDSGCLVSVAVLHANEAWAYAMLGSDDHVCDALARAEGELARVDADTVPSWARFFLAPADINGIAGVIYTCLATHPQHQARYAPVAIERSTRAFEQREPGEMRSRTFDAISLSGAYLLDGQLDQAELHAHTAIDMATGLQSTRTVDRLRGLAALAQPFAAKGDVASVLERVDQLATG
jgi:tetratricopeptide (TPR) repeat protein